MRYWARLALAALAAALAGALMVNAGGGLVVRAAGDGPYLNVWVHYDYMVGADGNFAPNPSSMQIVIDAFAAHGVTLHIDPQHSAIPEHKVIVPDWQSEYATVPGFDALSCTGPDAVRFSQLKATYFHPSSNHPWHYVVFGDFVFTDSVANALRCPSTVETGGTPPQPYMTGDSQIGFLDVPGGFGYSFVVTLGLYRTQGLAVPDRFEAGLFMHELGHNLGLGHGGPIPLGDNTWDNFKPNYLSVMNYDFLSGIPYAATPGSTDIVGYRVDYSDVQLPDLNESDLNEAVGIQDTAHPTDVTYSCADQFCSTPAPAFGPIDWNGDGNTTDMHLTLDADDDFGGIDLDPGFNDWAWIHNRLTQPAITGMDSIAREGVNLHISGTNLQGPATVIFEGGASAQGFSYTNDDATPNTAFDVAVPLGARSGPITVITPQAKITSSQSLPVLTTPTQPLGIAAGPDGNLWFTASVCCTGTLDEIARITPHGQVAEFSLPTLASPGGIVAGPDGNLWFTEANKIGRITPSGAITEFGPVSRPGTITRGADGNLWFTESPSTAVGRITPSGVITQFPLPPPDTADTITSGSDGNLWFTDVNTDSVGRITPSGTANEFPTPTRPSEPLGIASGPDGNLWFTEGFANRIGRITPSGTITEFPVPRDCYACEPDAITAGPDGNLWYTTLDSDNIGRMSLSGTVTEFPTPSASSAPNVITAGGDGNVWFTEFYAGKIGRVTPAGQITEFPIP